LAPPPRTTTARLGSVTYLEAMATLPAVVGTGEREGMAGRSCRAVGVVQAVARALVAIAGVQAPVALGAVIGILAGLILDCGAHRVGPAFDAARVARMHEILAAIFRGAVLPNDLARDERVVDAGGGVGARRDTISHHRPPSRGRR
jgi:hypothetical protein